MSLQGTGFPGQRDFRFDEGKPSSIGRSLSLKKKNAKTLQLFGGYLENRAIFNRALKVLRYCQFISQVGIKLKPIQIFSPRPKHIARFKLCPHWLGMRFLFLLIGCSDSVMSSPGYTLVALLKDLI